jgi:hypothetical protein
MLISSDCPPGLGVGFPSGVDHENRHGNQQKKHRAHRCNDEINLMENEEKGQGQNDEYCRCRSGFGVYWEKAMPLAIFFEDVLPVNLATFGRIFFKHREKAGILKNLVAQAGDIQAGTEQDGE